MILAIIQARMSSSRFPGKVLMPLEGKPMIQRQVERTLRAGNIDRLVVATSVEASDDPVEECCSRMGVECFRGNLDDVLDRFYQCATTIGPEHVMRLTADCPLADPELLDRLVAFYRRSGADYATNVVPRRLPKGLDAEIFSFGALRSAWRQATSAHDREHVTPYIRESGLFTVPDYPHEGEDLSHLRFTVDYPEDYEFVKRVYGALFAANHAFGTREILDLIDRRPELTRINEGLT